MESIVRRSLVRMPSIHLNEPDTSISLEPNNCEKASMDRDPSETGLTTVNFMHSKSAGKRNRSLLGNLN